MNLQTAKSLVKGDFVLDTDGSRWAFIGLDEENDVIVKRRSAMGGTIVLYRAMLRKEDSNE